MTIKNKQEKVRFGLVGATNTALDFGILFGLTTIGIPSVAANYASTGVAFLFSFAANRKFTFKATGGNIKKQLALFIIVTVAGLWAIQPIIIWISEPLFVSFGFVSWLSLLGAKLLATVASLTWNYIFYSRIVFTRDNTVK